MTEERENTKELKINVWDTDGLEDIENRMNYLIDMFDAYNKEGAYFKVTIELHYDGEEDENR